MAQILDIEDLRTKRTKANASVCCYCDAARMAREHFAQQLRDVYRSTPRPRILCLETLADSIPLAPSGGWDLIYSAAFFATLPASAARQVLKHAIGRLCPGGRLLVANVRPEVKLARCPLCRKFGSNHRGEIEMIELAKDLPLDTVTGQLIFRDRAGLNVYLELHKNAASSSEVSVRKIS